MQQNQNGIDADRLILDGRKRLTMTGVTAVDGFTEQDLKLTVGGVKVQIFGESIKITAYNKATGSLTADGLFSQIKYNVKKTPLSKRLFK